MDVDGGDDAAAAADDDAAADAEERERRDAAAALKAERMAAEKAFLDGAEAGPPGGVGPRALLRRGLSPIHVAAICRVYGDRDADALAALYKAPQVAAGILAKRLREKDFEWRAARVGLSRRWRRKVRGHFAKSLDHRAHFWRALDKKRCSSKWLVQEIKEITGADDDGPPDDDGGASFKPIGAADAPVASLTYAVGDGDIQKDVVSVLMLALEHSSTPLAEQKVVAREVWRDFVFELYGLPTACLAAHLPAGLSRGAADSGEASEGADRQPLPRGSRVITKRGDAVVVAFHADAPEGAAVEGADDGDAGSGEGVTEAPDDGDSAAPRPRSASLESLGDAPAPAAEARADCCYEVRLADGPRFLRPRDVFALDDLDMAPLADALAAEDASNAAAAAVEAAQASSPKPASKASKKGGGSKKKRGAAKGAAAADDAAPGVPFVAPPRSALAQAGAALANERVYVFARLHQMVYARLADARALCEAETARQRRRAAEPHDVADAIRADDDGEPAARADDDGDGGRKSDDGGDDGTGSEVERCCARGYAGFLELVAMLLCGDVTKAAFDDACRALLGNDGYRVRALDRLARATVDAMRALAADDTLKALFAEDPAADAPSDVDARKKALLAAVPAMASDDLYRASVQRNDAGDAQHLVLEFLGPLPAIESSDAEEE
mmetsp:Transcript_14847/g.51347  ORF Transcript_14847/g.51347 Transcript_14847/m.51347 type:complete len:672 (-) Transcript_14847:48-2063(-)